MILQSKNQQQAKAVIDRLTGLSLAFSFKANPEATQSILIDGKHTIEGESLILAYLDQLEAELHQWHYCNC